jgi:hypothetical protein
VENTIWHENKRLAADIAVKTFLLDKILSQLLYLSTGINSDSRIQKGKYGEHMR